MKPYRLVIYTDFSYRVDQGAVTAQLPFVLFINALADHEVELTVVGRLEEAGPRLPFALNPRIDFVGLPSYPSLASPAAVAGSMLKTLRAFARRTSDADAVWLFGPHPFALGFATIAALRGQRVILGVRQDLPALISRRRKNQRWICWAASFLEVCYRFLARACDTVVVGGDLAHSYGSARRLLNLPISLVKEAQIVDPAVALKRSYEGELTAISVGRLDPEKNPLLLADVLRELRAKDPRWRFEIYGRGSLAEELARRLEDFDLTEHAALRGYVPVDQGLVDAYRNSHALLHVSWTEGVPQVLFEAFAAGLPIVATDVGGVADAVVDAAVLIGPGDPVAAAAALVRIATDPTLRKTLIDGGLTRICDRTIEKQAERAIAFVTRS